MRDRCCDTRRPASVSHSGIAGISHYSLNARVCCGPLVPLHFATVSYMHSHVPFSNHVQFPFTLPELYNGNNCNEGELHPAHLCCETSVGNARCGCPCLALPISSAVCRRSALDQIRFPDQQETSGCGRPLQMNYLKRALCFSSVGGEKSVYVHPKNSPDLTTLLLLTIILDTSNYSKLYA